MGKQDLTETQERLAEITEQVKAVLLEKNKRYGNSATEPVDIFGSHLSANNSAAVNGILARLDDKLKRIQTSGRTNNELRKNDVFDLIGYLIILCESKNWTNFEDLLD